MSHLRVAALQLSAILAVPFSIAEHTADPVLIRAFATSSEPLTLLRRELSLV
jgi:hypothetical protein